MKKKSLGVHLTTLEPRLLLAGDTTAAMPSSESSRAEVVQTGRAQFDAEGIRSEINTVVFIDSRVEDFETLVNGISSSAEIHLVSPDEDAIRLISDRLARHQGLDSVHLITHGKSGSIQIGDVDLDTQTLRQHRSQIHQWSASLSEQADILVYGCNVAAGVAGQQWINLFAEITGADVAASDDATGAELLKGNWDLEVTTGTIEASNIASDRIKKTYQNVLPITIYAAGQTGEESMELRIDGEAVAAWHQIGGDVSNRVFQEFVFDTDQPIDPSRIEVAFTNDLYRPGEIDRNLMVDRIDIHGTSYESEAPNVLSNGTWDKDIGFAPRFAQYEFLHGNGSFQFAGDQNDGAEYRSFDGTGNNLSNPELGSTGELLVRVADPDYADGVSEPAGQDRPSPRDISNEIAAQTQPTGNSRGLSTAVFIWGQFIDHDIGLSEPPPEDEAAGHGHAEREPLLIPVPEGDPFFDPRGTGNQFIETNRTEAAEGTGTSSENPRQQFNLITAFIDGSMVYGSDLETANKLRTFSNGLLAESDGELLPYDDDGPFSAGDVRAGENSNLTAMHTLFMREHNRLAYELAEQNPDWDDETLYQEARRIVVGQIQAITYNEFLPALLGEYAIPDYYGYDPTVNPGIANEFAHAGYRLGHTMVNDNIRLVGNDGNTIGNPIPLRDAFFNPEVIEANGIDWLLKGMVSGQAEEIDNQIVDSLRNFLFGPPGAGGFDLASLNIARGRDHGLADYNSVRESYGLDRVESFAEITSDKELQQKLESLYGTVDNIDLWVGGLAEDQVHGSSLGELMHTIVADQFLRLRDGDRFWYENDLTGDSLDFVRSTKLSEVIQRNTAVTNIQQDVMFVKPEISGQITKSVGRFGSRPARYVTVSLYNDADQVVATTTTDNRGQYWFGNIAMTGEYRVVVDARGDKTLEQTVSLSRGDEIASDVDFELNRRSRHFYGSHHYFFSFIKRRR